MWWRPRWPLRRTRTPVRLFGDADERRNLLDSVGAPTLPIGAESRAKVRWDGLMAAVLLYIILLVPFRIGFNITSWAPWVAPDLLADLLIIADMLLWSVTTFEADGEEVSDLPTIRGHYLRGAFLVDVLTVLPLELFLPLLSTYHPWLRANRLLRLYYLNYYFHMWEMVSFTKPSIIRIAKAAFTILLLAHFIGCAFFLTIVCEGAAASPVFTGSPDITVLPLYIKYLRAYHWAFVNMTGYNNTNPQLIGEIVLAIITTFLGMSVVTITIGIASNLVTNLDSSGPFREKIGTLNDFMKYKRVPGDLQQEVRDYYTATPLPHAPNPSSPTRLVAPRASGPRADDGPGGRGTSSIPGRRDVVRALASRPPS